jgi:hypothetical protein
MERMFTERLLEEVRLLYHLLVSSPEVGCATLMAGHLRSFPIAM